MRRYIRQVTEKLSSWLQVSMPKASAPPISRDGESLRHLACLVVEENIDLDHLHPFLQSLMSEKLVELSGAARKVAAELSKQFSDLSPDDVAYLLRERAKTIDSHMSSHTRA